MLKTPASLKHTLSCLCLLAVAATAPALAHADDFHISFEGAGVQAPNQSTLCSGAGTCVIGTETFSGHTSGSGFTTNFGTGGVITGTYSPVQIHNADIYGGADGTGQYAAALPNDGYSVSLQTTLDSGINYFGYWLSALDMGNQVTFSKDGQVVYTFTPDDLIAALGDCSGSNPYCGNPNSNISGSNNQLYAFVNFYDTNGTFDNVAFSENPNDGNYESDNHTVGYVTAQSGTQVNDAPVPEPATLTLVGSGISALIARRRWRKKN